MTLFLGILSCVSLALVAGLLLTVGWWLYEFRKSYKQMPLLGEELTRQLMGAREALYGLQKSAKESGPELAKTIDDAQRLVQDLRFLTARAEEVAATLEGRTAKPAALPLADNGMVEVVPENVVTENVVAVASASRDPLEELLDDLGDGGKGSSPVQETEEEQRQPSPVPSQAEADLRRKLAE